MSRLPLRDLPLDLVLEVFRCYVLPIYTYGMHMYMESCSTNSLSAADACFTKFLKRYLGIPYYANNSITHFLTNTSPLTNTLNRLRRNGHGLKAFTMPTEMNGHTLSFLQTNSINTQYDPIPLVPSFFWRSRIFVKMPTVFHNRKTLCHEIFDLTHLKLCCNEKFHLLNHNTCICSSCGKLMEHYHQFFCE